MAPSFKNCTHTGEFHGGSLQGEIEATYADLVTLFGPPNGGDGYKVDAEWNLLFDDGTVANIYNYKDGINYNGAEEGTPTQKITNWHIGGQSPKAVLYVRQLLEGLPPAPAPAAPPTPSYKSARAALFGSAPTKKESGGCPRCSAAIAGAVAALKAPQPGDDLLEQKRSPADLQRITRDMGLYLQTHAVRLSASAPEKTLGEVINAFLAEFTDTPVVDLS